MSIKSVVNDTIAKDSVVNAQKPVPPTISGYTISGLDDTALDPAGGQTILLNGTGFQRGATVTLNGVPISVVSYVNGNQLSFSSPAQSAGTYTIYAVNADGGTAIYIPGLIYSNLPTWTTGAGTLGSYYETQAVSNTVVASGDAPIAYSLFSGALPTGTVFNANGVITGTAPADSGSTTYSFTIRATDAQLQDSTRSFSLTINTDVVSWSTPADSTTYTSVAGTTIANVSLLATSAAGSAVTYSANALPTGVALSGNTISGTPSIAGNVSTLLTATATTTTRSATRTINWTINVANDPYFKNTTLLLPGAGTTFVKDASTNNFAVTIAGDTRPDNFGPYTPGYYSVLNADSADTGFGVAANAALDLTADFTIECWALTTALPTTNAFQTSAGGYQTIFGTGPTNSGTGSQLYIGTTNIYFDISADGSGPISVAHGMSAGAWYHIAVTRSGTTFRVFVNGILLQTATSSGSWVTGYAWGIQRAEPPGSYTGAWWRGNISNFRVIKGTALYTAAFTPSTAPLTAITGTQLLVAQSSRFIDTSTNNFTITYGSGTRPQISSFQPFTPSTSYSTYGSAYFDGTGDYLTVAPSTQTYLSTDSFTMEAWVYPTAANGLVAGRRAAVAARGFLFGFDGTNAMRFWAGDTDTATWNVQLTSSATYALNQWYHVAATRNASNVFTLWVNGTSVATATASFAIADDTSTLQLGTIDSGSGPFSGYISNFRLVKGTAVYTTTFTPPSQPLTAIANTSLLTLQNNQSATNSVFLDNSTNNFAITRAGNSTQGTFSPYGANWSNYFDGTGDYLSLTGQNLNVTNFTIECWVNFSSFATTSGHIFSFGTDTLNRYGLYRDPGTGKLAMATVNSSYNVTIATTVLNIGTWYHVAWVKNGSTSTLYVNGVSEVTNTGSINSGTNWVIGFMQFGSAANDYVTGYISNFRVLNGTALYTTNFTPSTIPLTPTTTTSLLTCQSNRLIDNSANNFAITKAGDVSVQRFSPFNPVSVTPASYSGYFDGTGDYLSAPYSSSGQLGSSNFTIEFWIYFSSVASGQQIISAYGSTNLNYAVYTTSSGTLNYYLSSDGTTWNIASGVSIGSITTGTWYHVALVRNGSTFTPYLNGVAGTTATSSSAIFTNTSPTYIGAYYNGTSASSFFTGYISNMRIVKGTAVYTSAFTPPTTPLTAISGTQLLTLQSTTFIDNSTNAFAITAAGDTRPSIQNPFGSTSATTDGYAVSTIGGSGYFGSANYISTASNVAFALGTGDFTVEAWVYPTSAYTTYNYILGVAVTNGLVFYVTGGNLVVRAYNTGDLLSSATIPLLNAWTHVAATRNGTTLRIFVNGIQTATTTNSTNFAQGAAYIGNDSTNVAPWYGYISDFRLVKGTAVYTSNFVPPAAPSTAITNTQLLLNFTSAGIYDASTQNNLETVGDAKLSTAVTKWGGTSMYFDGTGDYMLTAGSQSTEFGAGDFTIELWWYPTSTARQALYHGSFGTDWSIGIDYSPVSTNQKIGIWASSNGTSWNLLNADPGGNAIGTTTLTQNAWNHIAFVRSGTSWMLFVNGNRDVNVTGLSGTIVSRPTAQRAIGCWWNTSALGLVNGYIDDFRVTKGYARYTANFTPPTEALRIK